MKQILQNISPEELAFDYKNPRIAEFNINAKTSERDIIKILWDAMGVEEIVLSIKHSGFFENEPLIGVVEDGKKIIIEGNRRLAAVKCILDVNIVKNIGVSNQKLFEVSDEIKNSLKFLPVVFVNSRADAWKFIGFKHINGPAKWGSFAKALYISEIKNVYNVSLDQITEQIGDTHNTVQKLYQGLQVIEQAERIKKFERTDIQDSRLYFSHLYTAITYEGVKEYLGLKDVKEETINPVPPEKADELESFLVWLYGSKKKGIEKIIQSQNPDLRRLEAVLKNKEATYALKDGLPLIVAYDISQPKDKTFEQNLLEAKRALQKAQSYQTEGFNGNDESILRLAGSVADIAEELYNAMEKKWSVKNNTEKKTRLS